MRVRVRLDQQRIGSLLQGISPQAMGSQFADVASGVLSMLGDMASLSFAGYHPGWSPSLWLCILWLSPTDSDMSVLSSSFCSLRFYFCKQMKSDIGGTAVQWSAVIGLFCLRSSWWLPLGYLATYALIPILNLMHPLWACKLHVLFSPFDMWFQKRNVFSWTAIRD